MQIFMKLYKVGYVRKCFFAFFLFCSFFYCNLLPLQAELIHDLNGKELVFQSTPKRVVVLYPPLSQLLVELGVGNVIVGATISDDFVPENTARIGSHMRPNEERIIALNPDLILMDGTRLSEFALRMQAMGIPVVNFQLTSFSALQECIQQLGLLFKQEQRAERAVQKIDDALMSLTEITGEKKKVKIFFEVRYPNLLGAGRGNFVHDLLERAGGENVLGSHKEKLVRVSDELLLFLDPDLYIMQQGPMNKQIVALQERPLFASLRATKTNASFVVEEKLFSRPSMKSLEALRILSQHIAKYQLEKKTAEAEKEHE